MLEMAKMSLHSRLAFDVADGLGQFLANRLDCRFDQRLDQLALGFRFGFRNEGDPELDRRFYRRPPSRHQQRHGGGQDGEVEPATKFDFASSSII